MSRAASLISPVCVVLVGVVGLARCLALRLEIKKKWICKVKGSKAGGRGQRVRAAARRVSQMELMAGGGDEAAQVLPSVYLQPPLSTSNPTSASFPYGNARSHKRVCVCESVGGLLHTATNTNARTAGCASEQTAVI